MEWQRDIDRYSSKRDMLNAAGATNRRWVMRSFLAAVIFGCLFVPVVSAKEDKEETESEAVERYNQILNAKTTIDVIGYPFSKLCSDLSKKHGIPITLDPKGLKEVGATRNMSITLTLKDIPLSRALTMLLKPRRLAFHVTPTGLVITALPKPPK